MKLLIVNADDYGMAVGVNAGIVEGHNRGIVTSATMMAKGNAFKDGIARLRDAPNLDIGCHLVLIGGEPAAAPKTVRSLLNGSDSFPPTLTRFMLHMASGEVKENEILIEFRAQIDRLLEAGVKLSHCDSHKHSHAHPVVLEAAIRLAEEYKIRYIRNPFERHPFGLARSRAAMWNSSDIYKRYALSKMLGYYGMIFRLRMRDTAVRAPDHFHGFVATGHLSAETMPDILSQMSEGVNELMCHPARLEPDLLAADTKLKESRERELAAVTSDEARRAIKTLGIQLTSFRELASN